MEEDDDTGTRVLERRAARADSAPGGAADARARTESHAVSALALPGRERPRAADSAATWRAAGSVLGVRRCGVLRRRRHPRPLRQAAVVVRMAWVRHHDRRGGVVVPSARMHCPYDTPREGFAATAEAMKGRVLAALRSDCFDTLRPEMMLHPACIYCGKTL